MFPMAIEHFEASTMWLLSSSQHTNSETVYDFFGDLMRFATIQTIFACHIDTRANAGVLNETVES